MAFKNLPEPTSLKYANIPVPLTGLLARLIGRVHLGRAGPKNKMDVP